MPGVRIHHPVLRSAVLAVESATQRYGRPIMCSLCDVVHTHKTRHVTLDGDGDAIVSETVWTRLVELQEAGLTAHKFLLLNQVANPPTQRVGFGVVDAGPAVHLDAAGTIRQIMQAR